MMMYYFSDAGAGTWQQSNFKTKKIPISNVGFSTLQIEFIFGILLPSDLQEGDKDRAESKIHHIKQGRWIWTVRAIVR